MGLADHKGKVQNPLDKLLAAVPSESLAAQVIREVRARDNHPLKLALVALASDKFVPDSAFFNPDHLTCVGYSKVVAGLLVKGTIRPEQVCRPASDAGFNLEMLRTYDACVPQGYPSWTAYQVAMNQGFIGTQAPLSQARADPSSRPIEGGATMIWNPSSSAPPTKSAKKAFFGYGLADQNVSLVLIYGQGTLDVVSDDTSGLIRTRLPGGLETLAQRILEEQQLRPTSKGRFNGYAFVAHTGDDVYTQPDLQHKRELALDPGKQMGDLVLISPLSGQQSYTINPGQDTISLADYLRSPLDTDSSGAVNVYDGAGKLVKPVKLVVVLNTPSLEMTEPDFYDPQTAPRQSIGTHNLGNRRLVRTAKLWMNRESVSGNPDERMMVYPVVYSS